MECPVCHGNGWLINWYRMRLEGMYSPCSITSAGTIPCYECGGTGMRSVTRGESEMDVLPKQCKNMP